MQNDISIEQVRPELTWRLRQQVLYPGQTLAEVKIDEDGEGYHFGAFKDNKIVAVASVFLRGNNCQFRKLAVDASVQNMGIGSLLLNYITGFAIAEGAALLWCNARVTAIPFYIKHGFRHTGTLFSKNGFDYEVLEKSLAQ